jgi:hypothetical protein
VEVAQERVQVENENEEEASKAQPVSLSSFSVLAPANNFLALYVFFECAQPS